MIPWFLFSACAARVPGREQGWGCRVLTPRCLWEGISWSTHCTGQGLFYRFITFIKGHRNSKKTNHSEHRDFLFVSRGRHTSKIFSSKHFSSPSKAENSDQAGYSKAVWILWKVGTIFVHISNSVGVNVFAASRPCRMTFPELVKSNQIKIDSDFLKMKLLKKEAHGLKRWKKTQCALTNILKNEILNLE